MSVNKPTLKTKPKEAGVRMARSSSDEKNEPDLTILRMPIDTSITGFYDALLAFESGTDEIRHLLGKECDILYECRVCRNMFRSMGNFLSHKRVYCTQVFNSMTHPYFLMPKFTEDDTSIVLEKERLYREMWQNSRKEDTNSAADEESAVPPITNDLTTIVEKLKQSKENTATDMEDDNIQFCDEDMPTKVAVFRTVFSGSQGPPVDTIKSEVMDLYDIGSRSSAVISSDGKFTSQNLSTGPVIQISDDDEEEKNKEKEKETETEKKESKHMLKCKTCDIKFSTIKTLKFHMKKHYESRIVYPCTDCSDLFSTSWSVYRHLYKVHRKTAAQIKRLRESIQSKTFRMDRPPVHYKKKKAMEEAANDLLMDAKRKKFENKAWFDNVKCEGVVPRCGGCGKNFERRAALAAHTVICLRRIFKPIRRQISPQPEDKISPVKSDDSNSKNAPSSNEDKTASAETRNGTVVKKESEIASLFNEPSETDPSGMDLIEKDNSDKLNELVNENSNDLTCTKCLTALFNREDLKMHIAAHFSWMRYICKLCFFKCYGKVDCVQHILKEHDMNGNKQFYLNLFRALNGVEAMRAENSMNENTNCTETAPALIKSRSASLSSEDSSANLKSTDETNKPKNPSKPTVNPKNKLRIGDTDSAKSPNGDDDSPAEGTAKPDVRNVMRVIFGEKTAPAPYSRPTRTRVRPVRDDFEYDLSHIARGGRSGGDAAPAPRPSKRKQTLQHRSLADSPPEAPLPAPAPRMPPLRKMPAPPPAPAAAEPAPAPVARHADADLSLDRLVRGIAAAQSEASRADAAPGRAEATAGAVRIAALVKPDPRLGKVVIVKAPVRRDSSVETLLGAAARRSLAVASLGPRRSLGDAPLASLAPRSLSLSLPSPVAPAPVAPALAASALSVPRAEPVAPSADGQPCVEEKTRDPTENSESVRA